MTVIAAFDNGLVRSTLRYDQRGGRPRLLSLGEKIQTQTHHY